MTVGVAWSGSWATSSPPAPHPEQPYPSGGGGHRLHDEARGPTLRPASRWRREPPICSSADHRLLPRPRTDNLTAAVYDNVTGTTSLYRPGVAEDTASIMKVDILATLLAQAPGGRTTAHATSSRTLSDRR